MVVKQRKIMAEYYQAFKEFKQWCIAHDLRFYEGLTKAIKAFMQK